MADYTQGTGSGGVMMIRDTGSTVEFWIKAGSSSTNVYDTNWSGVVNGVAVGGPLNYPTGAAWKQLAGWAVSYTQTVSFSIGATGTSGLGGPTGFSVGIPRAVPPAPPTPIGVYDITPTSLRYVFSGNSDGGSAILEWQMGYSLDPNSINVLVASNGSTTLTGLQPGAEYFFWSRGRNAVGWGNWSARISAKTLAAARVKDAGVWKYAIPYVKDAGVWKPAMPYVKAAGNWGKAI